MSVLSDHIEEFIKALLGEEDGSVELQRNELAHHFACAPSQINYVLSTRFTPEHGYMIESRRGGGGYVRVVRLQMSPEDVLGQLYTQIGDTLTQNTVRNILSRMIDSSVVTPREGQLMFAALSDKALTVPTAARDALRAHIFKGMLLQLMRG